MALYRGSFPDAMVEDHLATSSDHFTLSLSIPNVEGGTLTTRKNSRQDYLATRRCYPLGFNYEVQVARKKFQGVVGRAKWEYWRTLIDSLLVDSSRDRQVQAT